MNNYKIRVENRAESREAQELFFELGFSWIGEKAGEFWETTTSWIYAKDHNKALYGGSVGTDTVYKQITLPQLRDLVVLKRNDVGDATHTCNGCKYYLTPSEFFEYINDHWENVDEYVEGCAFEPIEKKMKEFLVKDDNKWTLQLLDSSTEENSYRVAVPSGMNIYWQEYGQYWFTTQVMGYRGAEIIWKRPETQSLNDQYAEIEKVRQATKETEYLMQGKNGDKLMESIKELHDVELPRKATEIADAALTHIRERASTYDQPEGERSAAKTAQAFNAITGHNINESEVWLMLQILKDVRQWSRESYHQDSAEDCIAYSALKAESLECNR